MTDVIGLSILVLYELKVICPRWSGSMAQHIRVVETSEDEVQIIIEAPQYDLAKFEREHVVVYTGEKPDYAVSVNEHGHFHSETHCIYWVNDSCYSACKLFASRKHNGSRVRCYLPLYLGGL